MVCAVEKKGRFHSYSEVTQDHTANCKLVAPKLCWLGTLTHPKPCTPATKLSKHLFSQGGEV